MQLTYHLHHPGGESAPGDPNAAFCLDGVYHLHYILRHPFGGEASYSFVHVTSPDMLHWTWQRTRLQPSFTGHGMFSGTGFVTKDGQPAAIYHGQGSGRNWIALAKDRSLSAWENPYPVDVRHPDGTPAEISHWDPDCFRVGDTYYAISGGQTPPLMRSTDLRRWTLVGNFLSHDLADVAIGEDISCPNFFPLDGRWVLLCISHWLGCRAYIGDWDAGAEQFVPERLVRMNWRRDTQGFYGCFHRTDFFAPESVLTPDGRRVMWAWITRVDGADGEPNLQSIQSLPRELSLDADGALRTRPLRELETLRSDPQVLRDVVISEVSRAVTLQGGTSPVRVASWTGDAVEVRITVARDQVERKLFGFVLSGGGSDPGHPIVLRPDTGTLRVGATEAPFAVAELPAGEDLELRVFVDGPLVEVFANGRQTVYSSRTSSGGEMALDAFTVGAPTTVRGVEIWKVRRTNQGFLDARESRIWEPGRSDGSGTASS